MQDIKACVLDGPLKRCKCMVLPRTHWILLIPVLQGTSWSWLGSVFLLYSQPGRQQLHFLGCYCCLQPVPQSTGLWSTWACACGIACRCLTGVSAVDCLASHSTWCT